MDVYLSRRAFVAAPCFLAAAGAVLGSQAGSVNAQTGELAAKAGAWPGFPHQDPAVVREFVGVCHRDIARVKAMLVEHPALAKSAWDWGYGDWESALGAAAHTGRREIAMVLIEHGARMDLFAAAMLGMTDVVRAMVAAQPGIEATPGPHGIMLLAHAEAGEHEPTIEYVKSLPPPSGPIRAAPAKLSDEEMAKYVGEYRSEEGMGVTVSVNKFGLAVKATGATEVRLVPTGTGTFHPVGAPGVLVAFTIAEGVAKRVEIVEAGWLVSAARVA